MAAGQLAQQHEQWYPRGTLHDAMLLDRGTKKKGNGVNLPVLVLIMAVLHRLRCRVSLHGRHSYPFSRIGDVWTTWCKTRPDHDTSSPPSSMPRPSTLPILAPMWTLSALGGTMLSKFKWRLASRTAAGVLLTTGVLFHDALLA